MLLWIVSFPLSLATYAVMTLLPIETGDNDVVGVVLFILTYFGQWQGIAAFLFWRARRMERDKTGDGLPTN